MTDPLTELGTHYGTDKVSHGFCRFYDQHLASRRKRVTNVLEIGVLGGASLRMWRDYFPNAQIHGLDRDSEQIGPEPRIRVHVGDQASRPSLFSLMEAIGSPFDLIIDDGGHTMEQQQVSLAVLFAHVRPGGIYILEDLHTSRPNCIINTVQNNNVVERYSSGADQCRCTSHQLVTKLVERKPFVSEFMSHPERDYLVSEVERGEVFDRDGDLAHVTSVIYKRSLYRPGAR